MQEILQERFFRIVKLNNVAWLKKFLKFNLYFDINTVDENGRNALHIAKGKSMVLFLINHRVNPYLRDKDSKLPADYCADSKVQTIYARLGFDVGVKGYCYESKGVVVGKVVEINKLSVVVKANRNKFYVFNINRLSSVPALNQLYILSESDYRYEVAPV